jgi:hypothetical protein
MAFKLSLKILQEESEQKCNTLNNISETIPIFKDIIYAECIKNRKWCKILINRLLYGQYAYTKSVIVRQVHNSIFKLGVDLKLRVYILGKLRHRFEKELLSKKWHIGKDNQGWYFFITFMSPGQIEK